MTRPYLMMLALSMSHCGLRGDSLERAFQAAATHDVPALAELAADAAPEARLEALRALVRDPSADAARAVAELVARVGVPERREILVTALETGRRDAATDALFGALCHDADPGNRAASLIGVGRLASLSASLLEALIAGLDDADPGVALGAFSGLRDQGWSAARALADALANGRVKSVQRAELLLAQITDHPLGDPKAWAAWLATTEAAMARVLAEGRWDAAAAESITRALDDDDPAARRAALVALVELAPPTEALAVMRAPNAKYPDERTHAAALLQAPPTMTNITEADDDDGKLEAEDEARSLDAAVAKDCSPELGTALRAVATFYRRAPNFADARSKADFARIDRCNDPRLSALAGLAAWNAGQVLPDIAGTRTRLLALVGDPDVTLRIEAIHALGELGAWSADTAIRDRLVVLLTADPAPIGDEALALVEALARFRGVVDLAPALPAITEAMRTRKVATSSEALVSILTTTRKPDTARILEAMQLLDADGLAAVFDTMCDEDAWPQDAKLLARVLRIGLASKETVVRMAAADTVADRAARDVLPELVPLCDDPSEAVAVHATRALGALADPRAQAPLAARSARLAAAAAAGGNAGNSDGGTALPSDWIESTAARLSSGDGAACGDTTTLLARCFAPAQEGWNGFDDGSQRGRFACRTLARAARACKDLPAALDTALATELDAADAEAHPRKLRNRSELREDWAFRAFLREPTAEGALAFARRWRVTAGLARLDPHWTDALRARGPLAAIEAALRAHSGAKEQWDLTSLLGRIVVAGDFQAPDATPVALLERWASAPEATSEGHTNAHYALAAAASDAKRKDLAAKHVAPILDDLEDAFEVAGATNSIANVVDTATAKAFDLISETGHCEMLTRFKRPPEEHEGPEALNTRAWNVLVCDKQTAAERPTSLALARKWAEASVARETDSYSLDTLALAASLQGEPAVALIHQLRALRLDEDNDRHDLSVIRRFALYAAGKAANGHEGEAP